MSTARIEEYLEAIYKVHEKTGRPANISHLAKGLGLSIPSTSEMLKKLARGDLITYNKQREIFLTQEGMRQAAMVVRRHRLAERFLTDMLGLGWEEVHDEACKLEHALGPTVAQRLAEKLGNPSTCPHGNPIPDKNGRVPQPELRTLPAMQVGDRAYVAQVDEENPDILRYLSRLQITPGRELEVIEIAPFGGPITLRVGGREEVIGRELGEKIKVSSTDPPLSP